MRVPKIPAVCQETFLYPTPWKRMTVTLYMKITEPLPVAKAFICAMRKEKHVYYTNLLGDPFTDPKIQVNAINPKECREYIIAMKCPREPLKHQAGKLFATEVAIDPPVKFPGAFKGIFAEAQTAKKCGI